MGQFVTDLLYLTYNRREFTEASLDALETNTNWTRVNKLVVYDDGSTDGADGVAFSALERLSGRVDVELRKTRLGNPVAIMLDFLARDGFATFAKLDSDAIVPPGWLDACLGVMDASPDLGLLGIEPPASRKRPAGSKGAPLIDPRELEPGPPRYVPCRAIGGLGMMRRSAFTGRERMRPHAMHGGFTDWQIRQADLKIGWIAPPLNLFLLDRMPIEPWASLSRRYIAEGWQRPWGNYTAADAHLWDWWPRVDRGEFAEMAGSVASWA